MVINIDLVGKKMYYKCAYTKYVNIVFMHMQVPTEKDLINLIWVANTLRDFIEMRYYYPISTNTSELISIHRSLAQEMDRILLNDYWQDNVGSYYIPEFECKVIPDQIYEISMHALAAYGTYYIVPKNEEITQTSNKKDDWMTAFQKTYNELPIWLKNIISRIDEIMVYNCRVPEPTDEPEFKTKTRYLFILEQYWSLFQYLLLYFSSAPISLSPNPLLTLIINLKYRIKRCIYKIGDSQLDKTITATLEFSLEDADVYDEWIHSIINEVNEAMETVRIDSGAQKFLLTKQENRFIEVFNLSFSKYKDTIAEKWKTIMLNAEGNKNALLGNKKADNEDVLLNRYFKLDLGKLIKEGENDYIEFKSTIRYDLRKKIVNNDLEYIIAKAISSFLNSKGGILVIGVNDDGKILGLEKDISTFGKKKNLDSFLLRVREIITRYLGNEYFEYLICQVKPIDSLNISLIKCRRSKSPVFLIVGNKQEFWIRASASSVKLNIKEATQYIKAHFNN